MTPPVKGRSYDASRRRAQASENRARVLAAARTRFLADGYAATTMAAIAADAGVSVETVYKVFGNKAGLVKSLFDVAVVGDDEPVALMDRPRRAEIEAEPTGRGKLRMYASDFVERMERAGAIQLLVRDAAVTDADAAAIWRTMGEERLIGMGAFAAHLASARVLRPGVNRNEARDVLWAYTSVELYELLVLGRGWSRRKYRGFLEAALVAALVA